MWNFVQELIEAVRAINTIAGSVALLIASIHKAVADNKHMPAVIESIAIDLANHSEAIAQAVVDNTTPGNAQDP